MARRSGLGKGLGALIPAGAGAEARPSRPAPQRAPGRVDHARTAHQPRAHFDEESLVALADVDPRGRRPPAGSGATQRRRIYELIAGERRWRAARRVGLQTDPRPRARHRRRSVPSSRRSSRTSSARTSTRSRKRPPTSSSSRTSGSPTTSVASRVGRSRATITNTLRLLQLPPAIQRLVAEGRLSARATPGPCSALRIARSRSSSRKRIVAEELSVRAVEEAVREHRTGPPERQRQPTTRPQLRPPGLLELEELLADHSTPGCRSTMGPDGQSRDRVRHARGPRADLPAHDAGAAGRRGALQPSICG